MEAKILAVVAKALHDSGMAGPEMGALSPYNSQIALIQHLAQEYGCGDLDCITVDRSQVRPHALYLRTRMLELS